MNKVKTLAFIALAVFPMVSFCQKAPAKLELPSLIGDNMILQQKTTAKLWGKTLPGQKVKVTTSWKASGSTRSDNSGNWQVSLSTPIAGGPYSITITGKDTAIIIKNVLIGEVWLCSGQSNMEMPLAGWPPKDTITHAIVEIAKANYPEIRLFNVQKDMSYQPKSNFSGKWEVCSPTSIKPFSATAFFFGKRLQEKLHVPVGLIESAWGGTPAESWISPESLKTETDFMETLDKLKNVKPQYEAFLKWLKSLPKIDITTTEDDNKWENLSFKDEACALENFDDSTWPEMKLPQKFEDSEIGEFDGAVWYRRTIEIPEQPTGRDYQLSLGPIDDMDKVYFNGTLVGEHETTGFWQIDRNYTIPASLVKPGKNTIAIRVLDIQGGGGIWGKPDQMKLSVKDGSSPKPLKLDGNWKYLPVAEIIDNAIYLFNIPQKEFFTHAKPKSLNPSTPTVLYNAMINPAINYQIKGAIWYQGEANVGRAAQYSRIFPMMISDWRKLWGIKDLPFYFVQLAPWIYSGREGTELPELREAQASALKLPNTGMAVILDIGNVNNIHPTNKTDVGDRLARLALNNDYKIKTVFSGPVYKSIKKEGNQLKLKFEFQEGGLTAKNNELKEFEIAGQDGQYYPANAVIINDEVILSTPAVKNPIMARYCWHNGSEASLFNKAGLPASGFIVRWLKPTAISKSQQQ